MRTVSALVAVLLLFWLLLLLFLVRTAKLLLYQFSLSLLLLVQLLGCEPLCFCGLCFSKLYKQLKLAPLSLQPLHHSEAHDAASQFCILRGSCHTRSSSIVRYKTYVGLGCEPRLRCEMSHSSSGFLRCCIILERLPASLSLLFLHRSLCLLAKAV